MKIRLKTNTKVLALPQELEVNDAEAKRLMMLGVAEKVEKVEKVEMPKVDEPMENTEPKKTKRASKK